MRLSGNALRVLEARYLRRDLSGDVSETPAELFERVAAAVAEAERVDGDAHRAAEWEERFHRVMTTLEFLPNSPALMNAGTPVGQLSACFVLPVEDSLEEIFDSVKHMALVQRTGGGTGFTFSHLRPAGDVLESSGGHASGPVELMQVFDCVTQHIHQGGRRRGANMAVLRCDHPDVLDFVRAKLGPGILTTFNLSVGVTDAFLRAALADESYPLIHPRTERRVGRAWAREVLDAIVDAAWRSGDPGLLFLDAMQRANPTPALGRIEATNPCGEVPLLPYESCNLGSISLARVVERGSGRDELDWEHLGELTETAVRFLDDAITVNRHPLHECERASLRTRKIGLGVMGVAEMLVRLGIPYDSPEAEHVCGRVMEYVQARAVSASQRLAEERGVFPAWADSVWADRGIRLRNATLTAIAPTGTIGILADTTPSIEPLFALAYERRNVLGGQTLREVSPLFVELAEARGLDVDALVEHVRETGSLRGAPRVPPDLARLFPTALEIPASRHLGIAAAFQRHVDNSVSKTINLPEGATVGDVRDAYVQAWRLGLKGVTVFRYGSKATQVMEIGAGEAPQQYEHTARCDPEECRV